MSKLFYYLGDKSVPYRRIMAEHSDFVVNGVLIPKSQTVIAEQTHSCNVHICTLADASAGFDSHPQIMNCDALITNVPNLFLLIRTADCTPVLLYDKKSQAVGAIHSGRVGTYKNIVLQTVLTMNKAYGSKSSDLKAWIGAGICLEHYPVSKEIWLEFEQEMKRLGITIQPEDFPNINIRNTIFQQLINAGLEPESIINIDKCTYENNDYYSYRKDGTNNRQINIIGLIDG